MFATGVSFEGRIGTEVPFSEIPIGVVLIKDLGQGNVYIKDTPCDAILQIPIPGTGDYRQGLVTKIFHPDEVVEVVALVP